MEEMPMPKRITPLSEIQVRNAKPKDHEYKLMDGYGLFLLVTPTSGKLWRFDYRLGDKRKTMAIGTYPAVSLAEARQRREDAKKLLANSVDPSEIKKAQKAAQVEAAANTFEAIARDWHANSKPDWSDNHAERLLKRLEQDVFPFIGSKPISDIKTPEIVEILKRVATRTLETAHRIKTAFYHIFHYAKLHGKIENNPAADLRKILPTVKYTHMAAPTDPKEVTPLLRAIDAFEGSFIVKCALQLAPLVFVRPGELRKAEWSEFDLDAATWNIPAEKMKMRQPHLVPLSRQVVAILKELQQLTGHSRYVFPCHRSPLRCMSENTVNASLRRMGFDKTEITGHGFRAMARTMLHEILQFTPDAIEAQLAHAVPDRLGRAYNRTSHLAERKKMMQQWADYLDALKAGAKVIQFSDRASR
jgi:integrase